MAGIDSFTKVMLQMEGANLSTTFTDSSLNPKTVTPSGGALISTAQFKFGAASGLFAADGDFLTIADDDDFDFDADFTVETFVRFTSTAGGKYMVGNVSVSTGLGGGWGLFYDGAGTMYFYLNDGTFKSASGAWSPSTDTWYHVAAIRNGTGITLTIDGASIGTLVYGTGITSINALTLSKDSRLNVSDYHIAGYLDSVRISKGIARWTSFPFTPPTVAYSIDSVGGSGNASLMGV